MNPIFYGVIVIFGVITLLFVLKERRVFKRQRQTISPEKIALITNVTPTVEYEMLLEHSSRLIALLSAFEKALPIKFFCVLVLALICLIVTWVGSFDFETMGYLWFAMVAAIILLPALLRRMLINRKIKTIMHDLPMFIDLVAVCVQSGMPVEAALNHATRDFAVINQSTAVVMQRVMRRAELHGLDNALKELYHSLPEFEVRMFSSALQQSVHFGASVHEHLVNLSADIRTEQLRVTEEKIGKLAAKISIPLILLFLFPAVILLTAPKMMNLINNLTS